MFKIGDKVRILNNIDDLIENFNGEYVEEMKSDLGKETEITEIYKENEEFVGYILKNSEYVWDERALELIKNDKCNNKCNINSTEKINSEISFEALAKAIENMGTWSKFCKQEGK